MRRSVLVAWSAVVMVCLLAGLLGVIYWKNERSLPPLVSQPLMKVESVAAVKPAYDVIVAGTDPEGVAAAVSAARNGLKVLLVDGKGRDRLGGLMTIGELNTLDLNYSPSQPLFTRLFGKYRLLNNGLFQEWYKQVEGSSFDIDTAANAFYRMVVAEPNIDLLMKVREMSPVVKSSGPAGGTVTGMRIVGEEGTASEVEAQAVIDATQDGDIAAAAGAPYTVGREDIGSRGDLMAATLVFRMSGVTPEAWRKLAKYEDAGYDRMSIWGYNAAREYKPSDPAKVRLRGLNIGRQNNETILINAMQLFGIDPLDPASVAEGMRIGREEAPRIAEFLKTRFDGFKDLQYAGTAGELYIRESRHIEGEYRLKLSDLLENRDHWDAIAYGSYPVDIQSTSSGGAGTILMSPKQYGVPFRTLVPLKVDGLLVVGRAASFDTIPHGSARVIPLGMATAQAAGAAVKLAIDEKLTLRELSQSEPLIGKLREMLKKQGVDLKMHRIPKQDYQKHKDYNGLLAAASMYLSSGGYDNKSWDLDGESNVQRYLNQVNRMKALHKDKLRGNPAAPAAGIGKPSETPLTLSMAAAMLASAAGVETGPDMAVAELESRGWLTEKTVSSIPDPDRLTNGDGFMLIYDMAVSLLKLEF